MQDRPEFTLRFADGESLELGVRTRVMGVLNVTPDSFSDGGKHLSPSAALAAAHEMARGGAEIIDVGGESTRPGADPVSASEEADRVLPVIEAIRRELPIRISIDTMKSDVARQAIDAGADLVNDVSAFRDAGMLELARARRVPVVLMHMRGTPRTMQRNPRYDDVVRTVAGYLEDAVAGAVARGIADDRIIVDPGIGFGKSASDNLTILRELPALARVGCPVLIGASRKSFIGKVLDLPVDERLEAGLAVAAYASLQGAHVIRTHDVAPTVRALRMVDALREG